MALIGLLLPQLVLIEKKQQLTGQLADAKELKEHVDRREKLVYGYSHLRQRSPMYL